MIGAIAGGNGSLNPLFAALPGNHVRQRLMSRAPWNKMLAMALTSEMMALTVRTGGSIYSGIIIENLTEI